MYNSPEELLLSAARPTVRAMREVESRLAKPLRLILAAIRQHFIEPNLTLARLCDAAGVSLSPRLSTAFRRETGFTPWRLVRECRLETAARLLRDTPLLVADIAFLIGYDAEASFSRSFANWCGMPPKVFRRLVREAAAVAGQVPEEAFTWPFRSSLLRRELSAEKAHEVIGYLRTLYAL